MAVLLEGTDLFIFMLEALGDLARKTKALMKPMDERGDVLPIPASWIELLERCLRDLPGKPVRHGVLGSVSEPLTAVGDFIVCWLASGPLKL